jgi:Ser/Thr protein kinase RdoA (MazF antagonist)
LRLAPTDEKLRENIECELSFIRYLRENGYPAAEPLASRSGEYLLTLKTASGEYFASAFRGVSGVRIDGTDYSNEIMLAYGKSLGRLHALSSRYAAKSRKWDYNEALIWVENVLSEYHATDSVQRERIALRTDLSALAKSDATYGLVHYDFEPDNVFFDAGQEFCNVIDFDDGMYHFFALDVEQAFGELQDALSPSDAKCAEDIFLRGYREEFELTPETLETLPLMRRFVDLFRYTRIIRSAAETFENEPDWMTGLRGILGSMTRDYEKGLE